MINLKIDADEIGTPQFTDDIARINVFLGTNGSGKSKLLNAIQNLMIERGDENIKVVRVNASRSGAMPNQISTQTENGKVFDDFDEETKESFTGMSYEAQGRLQEALTHFSTNLASEQVEYRKRHFDWLADGGTTDAPKEPNNRDVESHLAKLLSLFTEIFPSIIIKATNFKYTEKFNAKNMLSTTRVGTRNVPAVDFDLNKFKNIKVTGHYSFQLICEKNGSSYTPNQLSDGEKQILALLADRYFFKNTKCLFLIDEPELNLDPILAMRYWSLIEREMPNSIFVYTTHSMDFALRDNIERIWSLGNGCAKQIPLDELGSFPEEEQRKFLSGIRGIITNNKGLVVEGTETSFDAVFYKWITGDDQLHIAGYGSCTEVEAATKKLDIWQRIVPTAKVVGIVDSDYKSEDELEQLKQTNCFALDLHDAEAYLCHPKLLVKLADKLGRTPFPKEDKILDYIISFVEEKTLIICHHRAARKCSAKVQISLKKNMLSQVNDFDELKNKLAKMTSQYAESDLGLNETRVKSVLNEERRRIKIAKDKKNVSALLTLVNGKELLSQFSELFGLANNMEVMKYAMAHLDPNEFQHTESLKDEILKRFTS